MNKRIEIGCAADSRELASGRRAPAATADPPVAASSQNRPEPDNGEGVCAYGSRTASTSRSKCESHIVRKTCVPLKPNILPDQHRVEPGRHTGNMLRRLVSRKEDGMDSELERAFADVQHIEGRIRWARPLTSVAALVCSLWVVYRVFAVHGIFAAAFAFLGLGLIYGLGVSPMLAVAASVLCFGYRAVGMWFPLLTYVLAAILLYADLKRDRLMRRLK